MNGHGSLNASLLNLENRYIYQIAGANQNHNLIARLDMDKMD